MSWRKKRSIRRENLERSRERSRLGYRPEYRGEATFVYEIHDCRRCHGQQTYRIPTTSGNQQCMRCGKESAHPGVGASDYFWKVVRGENGLVRCKACEAPVEQNIRETVAHCWTKDCPAQLLDASSGYRCFACGSSGLRYTGGLGGRALGYRCADCNTDMKILERSAC